MAPSFEAAPHPEPATTPCSAHLQRAVLDNGDIAALGNAAWPRAAVDRHDPSLQFHACHTRLREVQVLHDQLRALLEADREGGERLRPRDIAVLAPDIDAYAPHIEAVFGGALGSAREIPYTIADASPLASAPLAAAFLRLLELPLRALSVIDVLDLLAVPAIAARFDIDDNERGALQDWLDAAGARWAFDADDRARHGAQRDAAYTLEFALDRLLLGYASGGEGEDDIAGVAPGRSWKDRLRTRSMACCGCSTSCAGRMRTSPKRNRLRPGRATSATCSMSSSRSATRTTLAC